VIEHVPESYTVVLTVSWPPVSEPPEADAAKDPKLELEDPDSE
jgi:hypothetical protein